MNNNFITQLLGIFEDEMLISKSKLQIPLQE